MRKLYLLIGLCCLIYHQALPQYQTAEAYASAKLKHPLLDPNPEASSLKSMLNQLEKQFSVSIAYKDELVGNKTIQKSDTDFSSVESALDDLLEGTNLSYEKVGNGFYVISKKNQIEIKLDNRSNFKANAMNQSTQELWSNSFLASSSSIPNLLPRYDFTIEEQAVTGKVTDETGQSVPGVNILEKGTSNGTTTDADGIYKINVVDANSILVFSFIGYSTVEEVVGTRAVVDIALQPDIKSLDEIVVTALGIEKSAKSLGYATSKVSSDQLAVNRTTNFMNALTGKIAGVSISAMGTGPAGTSKIRIRGQTSIGGQNNPLIVINGVPVDNTNFGTNPGSVGDNSIAVRAGGGNQSDGGDGLTSINPDDIESMSVLKGAAASALYGSRANNGVIMITTKSRGAAKGLGITYNMNYTNETPLDYTDYQYQYGQGEQGVRPTLPNTDTGEWSFGEKFQPGMTYVLFNNLTVPYKPQRNIIRDFYRNGQNLTNTVSIASSGDKGGMNLSLSHMASNGIVPNNSFTRYTANLGFSYDLSDKLTFRGNINYSNEYNKNPPNVGNQDNTIPTTLMALANSMPLKVLEANKYNASGDEYVYSRFRNRTNPYFTLAEQFQNIKRDRIFGNIAVKYNILKWLYVQGRVGQDYWSRDQDYNNFPTGQASLTPAPAGFVNGRYTQEVRRFREINTDFLISATKEFGDFGVNVTAGGNQMRRRSDYNSVQVIDFVVRGLYTIGNGRTKDPIYDLRERAVNSLYGSAEVSYKDFLYLNTTLRNDWFSTLSPENRSIPYASVSASYILSQSFSSLPEWLEYAKVRAAYARVGSDTDVPEYSNLLYYSLNGQLLGGQPVGGSNGNTLPNANLVPMTTDEVEFGIESKLFQNRVGLELSVYKKITKDQIVQAQISDASGFENTRINSGKSQNKGIELMLNLVPVKTPNFSWEFTTTGAYNITKVLSLATDVPGSRITVATGVFNGIGEIRQIVGEEMGQIAGYGYLLTNGQRTYGANGLPIRTPDLINYGSGLPKWVGGFTNSFNYKGIIASFLIDFKLGNKLFSFTNFNAMRHGLHKASLVGRAEGFVIGEGVDINGNPNTAQSGVQSFYEIVRTQSLIEPIVYNGGYWKLRQITLGYDLTKHLPAKLPVKGLRLSLVANNVLLLKKWIDNIDPETAGFSSDNLVGIESPGVPTTRSIGFNLNAKF